MALASPVRIERRAAPNLQRCGDVACPPGACRHDDQRLSRAGSGHGPATAPSLVGEVLATPGSALHPSLRTDMEQRLGHDFGAVRVHADSRAAASADAVASLAYTVGNHVVLGRSVATGAEQGRRVLAHELVHTIQQGSNTSGIGSLSVSSPSDASEREAERQAQAAISRSASTIDPEYPTGAVQASTPSALAVQRACGGAEIGSVAGCAERGGDIADFGSTSEDVFFFVRDCDDLAAGEQARLAGYAARIGPDDEVTIDAFASEEGAAEFNLDLSCARAKAAADVLTVAGAVPSAMRLYSHGATPGDRPMHRSVVITVSPVPESRPPTTPQPQVTPPPSPAVVTPPAPETEDCEPWQTTMLTDHLKDARTWVNDAYQKIADYAYVFASPRHSAVPQSAATASVVQSALLDNFHTTEAGHVLQIRDNFAELRTELNSDLTFECEDSCPANEYGYVLGLLAFIRRLGDIHVCPVWFSMGYFRRVAGLIHERAHQYPGATDNAYDFQANYPTLSPDDAIDNAESYAMFARQVYHGGAHGPRTGDS